MSSSGSPYARFRRALATGNLHLVHAAAAELPTINLADALAIALLYGDEDARAERAAVRWLARFALESPSVRIEDLRAGLLAFEALPHNPEGARALLGDLCAAHGLVDAAAVARSAADKGRRGSAGGPFRTPATAARGPRRRGINHLGAPVAEIDDA